MISGLKALRRPDGLWRPGSPALPHFSRPFLISALCLSIRKLWLSWGVDWRLGGAPGLWPMLPNASSHPHPQPGYSPKSRALGVFPDLWTQG